MKIPIRLRVILYTLLAVVFVWCGISHVSFLIYGDARIYLADAAKVEHGMVAHNVRAFLNGVKEHDRLVTEGGYPFLLAAAKQLHAALPFVLNGILVAAIVVLLMLTTDALFGYSPTGFLAALLVPIFLLLADMSVCQGIGLSRHVLWFLTYPLRSTPSYLLALAALWLGAHLEAKREDTEETKTKGTGVVVVGCLLGLAAWTRISNLVFVIPAMFIVPRCGRKRFRYYFVAYLLVGLLLGLLPLFMAQSGFPN